MSFDLIFYTFAILTLAAAGVVAFSANILRSAFALLLCFFGVAAIYVMLGADFLAGIQVLIYVGGVVVLILFAILVTSKIKDIHVSNESKNRLPAAIVSTLLFAVMSAVIWRIPWNVPETLADPEPTSMSVGTILLQDYLLPFELVSILLLAALMGAAIIVRKEMKE